MFLSFSLTTINGQNSTSQDNNSASKIIGTIIKNTGASTKQNTVDVIKEGDPETQVTGIVTCMFATMKRSESVV